MNGKWPQHRIPLRTDARSGKLAEFTSSLTELNSLTMFRTRGCRTEFLPHKNTY